jgi:hypothetical protein
MPAGRCDVTTGTRRDARVGEDCYRTARTDGLIAALDLLTDALLPGTVPFGPAGHAVTTSTVAGSASHVWHDGFTRAREPEREQKLTAAASVGPVVILRHAPSVAAGEGCAVHHDTWLAGLAWLRLGLSEALRRCCMSYLGRRRTGATATLLQQQMVKGSVADAVSAHLEVHAVLREFDAIQTSGMAERLHGVLTGADRTLVRLLGASGYVTGGEGETMNVSELLADAYCRGEPPW